MTAPGRKTVIYLDWRLFGAASWQLFALAVDPPILQPAWRGFEAKEEGAVSC